MIKGKIVRILSETDVILNVGTKDGVKEGLEFVIFIEGGTITDPENGKSLGILEIVKGRVKVSHAMELMSQARTLTYSVELPGWTALTLGHSTERRQYRLSVRKEDVDPLAEDQTVRIGDDVRSV